MKHALANNDPMPSMVADSVFVLPGQVRFVSRPTVFTTILGSCVAICLFDPETKQAGINHFLMPGSPGKYESEPARWAKPSIEMLVARSLALGANLRTLRAKVFGGACMTGQPIPKHLRIGERNVDAALAEMDRRGINVILQHVGGTRGRKLVCESHTGRCWVEELGGGRS